MKRVIAPQTIKIGLWKCLKSGVDVDFPDQGTPQGGIVSPLLANVALNGIERIGEYVKSSYGKKVRKGKRFENPENRKSIGIRYADDMVRHEARIAHGARTPAARRRAANLSP